MSDTVPKPVAAHIEELIAHYPEKRSAALMVLHALQEHFGYLSRESIEWTAARLGVEPIQILELVTFYPMFRQAPVGRFHLKICRTLSCALGGSHQLYQNLCAQLGLNAQAHGPQTTPDGRVTVEFVECLASCHTAPVLMCNNEFMEKVTPDQANELLARCR